MPLYNAMGRGASPVMAQSAGTEYSEPPTGGGGGKDQLPKGVYRDDNGKLAVNQDYYKINAKFQHYKMMLREKLKEKDPEAFDQFIKEYGQKRIKEGEEAGLKYALESAYDKFLAPEEVKSTLGDKYDDYIKTLKELRAVNDVTTQDRNLAGAMEGQKPVEELAFGKRFATMPVKTAWELTTGDQIERTDFTYNPSKGDTDVIVTRKKKGT